MRLQVLDKSATLKLWLRARAVEEYLLYNHDCIKFCLGIVLYAICYTL